MLQSVASSGPVTVPPIWAAVRWMPSRTKSVGVQVAAIAVAGTAATAIAATRADAEARLASRPLLIEIIWSNAPSRGSSRGARDECDRSAHDLSRPRILLKVRALK